MELRQIEFGVVKKIYQQHLCNDFVPAEQKPLIVIQILMKMGLYRCFGLYEQEELKGYAFFCESGGKEYKTALMDYLVIIDGKRGKGYGSEFLRLIQEEYKNYDCLIAEVERVEAGNTEQEYKIRDQRKRFYQKNHWTITRLSVDLFGEDLQIYVLPCKAQLTDSDLYEELSQIYDKMFYEPQVRQKVILKK